MNDVVSTFPLLSLPKDAVVNTLRTMNLLQHRSVNNPFSGHTAPRLPNILSSHSFPSSAIMDDVVSTFPLLRLPEPAILNTFKTMSLLKIFGISLLSKKTKNLVESLKMKIYTLQVAVGHFFEFFMVFPNLTLLTTLYYARENQPPKEIDTPPEYIYGLDEIFQVEWANSMSVKQLLEHLRFIFHKSTVTLTFGTDSERFSVESLHRNVKDIESISFFNRNDEQHRRILNMFQPASLTLDSSAFFNHVPEDYLIQNFDLIRSPSLQNTLDSLLMTNACSVQTSGGRQSAKLLNKFLKLWANGSNPRLEFLLFRFRNPAFQTEELLRGLSYTNVPLERVRLFKCSDGKEPKNVSGGFDINRFDGTQATIKVSTMFGAVEFELFVWYDHCVVN